MKIGPFTVLIVIACSGILEHPASARQGFMGHRVSLSREIPSWGFTYGPFEFVAQPGWGDAVSLSTVTNLVVNVESDFLYVFFPSFGSGGHFPAMGHYILFEDLSPSAPSITGLTFATDVQGFYSDRLAFTDHTIIIGLGGLNMAGGEFLIVGVEFVPEPEALGIFSVGAALHLLTYRHRRKLTLRAVCRDRKTP